MLYKTTGISKVLSHGAVKMPIFNYIVNFGISTIPQTEKTIFCEASL